MEKYPVKLCDILLACHERKLVFLAARLTRRILGILFLQAKPFINLDSRACFGCLRLIRRINCINPSRRFRTDLKCYNG